MKKHRKLFALIITLFYILLKSSIVPESNIEGMLFIQLKSFLDDSYLESVLYITQVKSFLDEEEKRKLSKTSIFHNDLLENLIKDIKSSGGFFNIDQIKKFFIIRSFLFSILGKPLDRKFTIEELIGLKNSVMDLLYEYKQQGFINTLLLERNKIYNLYRSLFLDEFIFSKPNTKSLREIEYFQSLITLVLILEYELHIKFYERKLDSLKKLKMDTIYYKEGLQDLRELKRELIQSLSTPIKQTLTGGRLQILDRIYTGFDTEYQSESDVKNSLLAYSTSTYSKVYLHIKPFRLELSENPPRSRELLLELIKLIRKVINKQDLEIEKILDFFSNDPRFKKQITKNFIAFTLDSNEFDEIKAIKNSYYDLETDPDEYSFKNLVEKSLQDQNENVFILNQMILNILKNYKIPRVPVKKELYLIAHFTTADICSLSDFEEIKNKFSILRKSFVSLDKTMRIGGWKILLRDTALLSPTGSSLSSIGDLYTSEFKKIELSKTLKLDMKKLKVQNLELFRSYAMQDSKITL